MIRTQISLTEEQAQALRRLSHERRISTAALVREAVDGLLANAGRAASWRRAVAAVGAFASEPARTSVEHDEELARAYRE